MSKKKPKILLTGMNYASTLNSLVIGFEQNEVDVKAISFETNRSKYNNFNKINCVFPNEKVNYFYFKWLAFIGICSLFYYAKKSDVIHVYSDLTLPTRYQNELLNFLFNTFLKKKKKFVTFVGSDVRIPEIESSVNKFYTDAYSNPNYEYKYESIGCSKEFQSKFFNWGFELICSPDTAKYILPEFFKPDKITQHAGLSAIVRKPSDSDEFLVIHAPSAPIAKGSYQIRENMKILKNKYPQISYHEITNVSNLEYQDWLAKSDLLVDQIMWGYYGVATIQALAAGIPTACYIASDIGKYTPINNLPIINLNPDNFIEVFSRFIEEKSRHQEISEHSIAFYEATHSPKIVAKQLLSFYNS